MTFRFVLVTPAIIEASLSPKIYHSFILAKREISERALYFVLTQESFIHEGEPSKHILLTLELSSNPFSHGWVITRRPVASPDLEIGFLDILSRRMTGCPRPLKIISAQPSGHVHNFTDEIQPRHFVRLHRLG